MNKLLKLIMVMVMIIGSIICVEKEGVEEVVGNIVVAQVSAGSPQQVTASIVETQTQAEKPSPVETTNAPAPEVVAVVVPTSEVDCPSQTPLFCKKGKLGWGGCHTSEYSCNSGLICGADKPSFCPPGKVGKGACYGNNEKCYEGEICSGKKTDICPRGCFGFGGCFDPDVSRCNGGSIIFFSPSTLRRLKSIKLQLVNSETQTIVPTPQPASPTCPPSTQ
eukprot:TRINITY_DN116_c0_g1_i6.p1 TRINITY_DN116_c0_g1~~TRINITY_DN116_c0_g1_i6.p1  ORF type:complete len:221 (-),score=100.79 TRINITY_DN116_c0_g1_i6:135-797(-)